ncbi:RsmB/NOP family class I SAM-dependent RNA methyltransferase [Shewanella sp.]|uniref:RsmB/NOP family class I SAM-dependent RNA methyltransferase n=1 Tax=Shewanella sp. TaxID=50422 RepID=UPI003A983702
MTPIEKRALSYATTINGLFDDIITSKKNADRVIAEYFRATKKHGAKDRRIIRETLFGLFRWWGWLQQLQPEQSAGSARTLLLYLTSQIEQHAWQDIAEAWATLADTQYYVADEIYSPQAACRWLNNSFAPKLFTLEQLVPDWLWQYLPADFTAKEALIESLCQRPPIWGRVQRMSRADALAQLQAIEIAATAGHFSDTVNLGQKSINLQQVPLYRDGHLEVQDLASQVIGQICAPHAGEHWWDACCGAGGKTLQLASLMEQAGNTVADIVVSDVRPAAMNELQKRAQRAGFSNISTAPWQDDTLPVASASFDGVLVDAPCSCIGTWRRNPDQRWLDDESVVNNSAELQQKILQRAAAAVKPAGVLVYATCSITATENQLLVEKFLQQHPEFTLETVTHPFTGSVTQYLTIWPFEADSDGMFVARLRRAS